MKPELRRALDKIQDMLDGKSYSAELWDILVALRGPDSRNRKVKNATTALIRTKAFPKRPCLERSVFAIRDTAELAKRRQVLLSQESNHFREHVTDAFAALGLKLEECNDSLQTNL
jgi:hypothetical protein